MIGETVTRVDGVEKVTGAAPYVGNLELPGMLYAKLVRSTIPHARLLKVDASRAEALPGVWVYSREDVSRDRTLRPYYGSVFADRPVVALDRVRFVGEPVAAVAAESPELAEEAAALIEVEYEELPALLDPVEAWNSPTLIHEQWYDIVGRDLDADHSFVSMPERNACNVVRLQQGDIEEAFRRAEYVLEGEYTSPTADLVPLEPHTALAQVHVNGKVTVWSCSQTPFAVRAELARMLGVTVNRIRVIVPYVGGGYGAKTNVKIEHLPVLLARKAGRPVKLTLTHNEIFFTVTKHAARIRLRTAATRAGDLLGQAVEIYWDTGAYADTGPQVSRKATYTSCGPYRIPAVRIEGRCVYTNKPPAGSFRGLGTAQVNWAYESQLDTLARELGVDPVELRRRNLYREGEPFITGEPLHSLGVRESLEQVARSLRWAEWRAARRAPDGPWVYGKGLACTLKNTVTPSGSSAAVKLNEDGTVEVLCATIEIGQGARTVLSQIVAQEMGLPVSGVTFAEVDTDVVPFDRGTISARSTFHMGRALQAAVADLKEQLVAVAADLLEASPADLVVEGGRVSVRGTPEQGLSFAQINRRHFGKGGGTFFGRGAFKSQGRGVTDGQEHEINSVFWFGGAAGAEVAVNTRTGEIRVLHLVNATDAGKALNPLQVEAQIRGCAILGYGGAMFEEVAFEGGQPINASLLAYRIPCAADLPEQMEAIIVETPHREGPYGSKGVGETAVAPVAPAIGNAVADALGIRLRDLPLTPDKVLRALRERSGASAGPEVVRSA